MKKSYLKECVESYSNVEFGYYYILPGAKNNYATATLKLYEDERGWRNVGAGDALDLLEFCNRYNQNVGKQVLELNLYRHYGNSDHWELYERDNCDVHDELQWRQHHGFGCLPYDLETEREFRIEAADNYEDETSRKAYLEGVDRMFRKIEEELEGVDKDRKVLVWEDPNSLDYEIVDRCPDSWEEDCYYYRYYLNVCDGYDEDDIDDLDDLAEYLNGCLDKPTALDPTLFVEEWCDEHDCIFNPGDPSYEFSARFDLDDDWVWDRNKDELLRIGNDGKFEVVDIEEEDGE